MTSELRVTTLSNATGDGPATLTKQSAAKAYQHLQQTTNTIQKSLNLSSSTDNGTGDFIENREDIEEGDELDKPYFWTLPLPKERNDKYAPRFVTNSSDDDTELINMGLKPGQYFTEILDFDGLGFCTTEEELEILYRSLTGKYIEQ